MKYELMKFIKWEGEYALFKKANIADKLICALGLNVISYALDITEGKIILIKVPKQIVQEKAKHGDTK